MSVSYGKGKKGAATKLHSKLIRSIGRCEAEGYDRDCTPVLQTAHIIGRKYSATRTMLNNAFCMCSGHHFWFTSHPLEFSKFVDTTWASDIYDDMFLMSRKPTKKDWEEEVERLKQFNDKDIKEARKVEWDALT